MFGIVWMRQRQEIAREQSGLKEPDEVVRYARAKAGTPLIHTMTGGTPDEFRIIDAAGQEIVRQQLVAGRPSA